MIRWAHHTMDPRPAFEVNRGIRGPRRYLGRHAIGNAEMDPWEIPGMGCLWLCYVVLVSYFRIQKRELTIDSHIAVGCPQYHWSDNILMTDFRENSSNREMSPVIHQLSSWLLPKQAVESADQRAQTYTKQWNLSFEVWLVSYFLSFVRY